MPASRVTSRRLRALKLWSSRSFKAAATIARRVVSLRSSRETFGCDGVEEPERRDREVGTRLFTAEAVYGLSHHGSADQSRGNSAVVEDSAVRRPSAQRTQRTFVHHVTPPTNRC